MRAFLDFEASSLGRHGFTIDVVRVFESGILAEASARFAGAPRAHRALPDVRSQRERWLAVAELAHAFRTQGESL